MSRADQTRIRTEVVLYLFLVSGSRCSRCSSILFKIFNFFAVWNSMEWKVYGTLWTVYRTLGVSLINDPAPTQHLSRRRIEPDCNGERWQPWSELMSLSVSSMLMLISYVFLFVFHLDFHLIHSWFFYLFLGKKIICVN